MTCRLFAHSGQVQSSPLLLISAGTVRFQMELRGARSFLESHRRDHSTGKTLCNGMPNPPPTKLVSRPLRLRCIPANSILPPPTERLVSSHGEEKKDPIAGRASESRPPSSQRSMVAGRAEHCCSGGTGNVLRVHFMAEVAGSAD